MFYKTCVKHFPHILLKKNNITVCETLTIKGIEGVLQLSYYGMFFKRNNIYVIRIKRHNNGMMQVWVAEI